MIEQFIVVDLVNVVRKLDLEHTEPYKELKVFETKIVYRLKLKSWHILRKLNNGKQATIK